MDGERRGVVNVVVVVVRSRAGEEEIMKKQGEKTQLSTTRQF